MSLILISMLVCIHTYLKGGISLKSNTKSKYGVILTRIIKEKKITQQDFYNQLGIRKSYFYDIISGKANPPPPQTQLKILEILSVEDKDKKTLLDIAANERNELPADILLYLENNIKQIEEIRCSKKYKKFADNNYK